MCLQFLALLHSVRFDSLSWRQRCHGELVKDWPKFMSSARRFSDIDMVLETQNVYVSVCSD
jgi:hypothetical protein